MNTAGSLLPRNASSQPRALVLAELTEGNDPDGSLEDERERQHRVVHPGVLDDMGLPHFVDALRMDSPAPRPKIRMATMNAQK